MTRTQRKRLVVREIRPRPTAIVTGSNSADFSKYPWSQARGADYRESHFLCEGASTPGSPGAIYQAACHFRYGSPSLTLPQ